MFRALFAPICHFRVKIEVPVEFSMHIFAKAANLLFILFVYEQTMRYCFRDFNSTRQILIDRECLMFTLNTVCVKFYLLASRMVLSFWYNLSLLSIFITTLIQSIHYTHINKLNVIFIWVVYMNPESRRKKTFRFRIALYLVHYTNIYKIYMCRVFIWISFGFFVSTKCGAAKKSLWPFILRVQWHSLCICEMKL